MTLVVRSFAELDAAQQRDLVLHAVWTDNRGGWASYRRRLGSAATVTVGPLNESQTAALDLRYRMQRQIVSA